MYSLLIVDDEPLVIRAITHIVQNNIPQVKIQGKTASGSDAVEIAREKQPEIIFMDIKLEGLNGLEAIKKIQEFLPESKIIIISAYDNFQFARRAIQLGVMDYLLKPVNKEDITQILDQAVKLLEDSNNQKTREINNPQLARAKKYIEKNYHRNISLDDIAEHAAISPNYLSKLFKEKMEINIVDYLTNVRIDQAKNLLETTSLPIKQIAYRVGYNDPNYFSKVFKKTTSLTPTNYRNKG
ncbi:MAG: response regulator transcription factor [Halanaerobiaceae bacterium]